jgi:hypothetical protein
MNPKEVDRPPGYIDLPDEMEALYHALIEAFYEREDRERARTIAGKLEEALNNRPEVGDSIRGEEIRSLIAELNGNLREAIRRRESEIRKILELHSLGFGKPSWDYVFRQYDYSDVSDRLDILACLYENVGDWDLAIATLRESRVYCDGHGIPFDGQDLLNEFEQERANPDRGAKLSRNELIRINDALRDAYKEVAVPSDQLLTDDDACARLFVAFNRRIPGVQLTMPEIRKFLSRLRKKGESKGGLPKLGVDRSQRQGKRTA